MSSRNDHSVGYDHTLLSSVPDPTRAEKQEGYNVGLLEDSGRPNGARAPAVSDYGGGAEYVGPAVAIDEASKAPYGTAIAAQPWYRRKWGIIGIAVVALVIIGAVVGGAVGATHHSNSHSAANANGTVTTGNNSTTNGTDNGSNGTGSGSNSTNGTNGVVGITSVSNPGVAQGSPSTRAGQGAGSVLMSVTVLPTSSTTASPLSTTSGSLPTPAGNPP